MAANEGGWRIGTFAGAAVIVEPTILILAVYVLGSAVLEGGLAATPFALTFLAAILIAVLIHEFAHAAVAAMLRIPSKRIVLTFFGGYVQFAWPPKARWHEIAVAAAGPLSNLACAAILYPLMPALRSADLGLGMALLDSFFYASLILGAFNLLPGHPLDGGQILRATLNYFMSRKHARLAAGWCGLVLAGGIAAWAVTSELMWTAFMCLFLGLAAWGEIRNAGQPATEDAAPSP